MIKMKMVLLEDAKPYLALLPETFHAYYSMPRTYVMHAVEGETFLGAAAASVLPDGTAQILDEVILSGGFPLFDGLCRALLNFLDICGVEQVFCGKTCLLADLVRVGFHRDGERARLQLKGFFDAPCASERA